MKYQVIPVTPFAQNCTVIWCPDTLDAAVVDPGGDMELITNFVEQKGLKVKQVLLTHGHIDHAGASAPVSKHFSAPIVGPQKDDLFWIEGLPSQSQMFGFPKVAPFVPDRWLNHGDEVELGQQKLEVRCCPGHTPGHVVFVSHESNWVIVGDVIFQNSIGRTDFPQGDFDTLMKSIKEQILSLPEEMTILPGHGPTTTVGQERRGNPFIR